MISIELYHAVWEFIEGQMSTDDLWVRANELPLNHSIYSEESEVFAAICLCSVHVPKRIWTEDEARKYLRRDMRGYPTAKAAWELP